MRTLLRLYHTLSPLKPRQLFYLVYYPFKKKIARRKKVTASSLADLIVRPAKALYSLDTPKFFYPEKRRFVFLNREAIFDKNIDWEFAEHGALWAFHLNYFEWLADDFLTPEVRLETMLKFALSGAKKTAWLPYPTSLRILAWSRFLSRFPKAPIEVYETLAEDAYWLLRFPEFQLDGNHLWENGLALVVAGIFLGKEDLQNRGKEILSACLREQILEDGGQMERSPMYQSLLLWRLLQGVELIDSFMKKECDFLSFLKKNAVKMLSWLQQVTFSDGSWPMVNDSAFGMAPDTKTLSEYARKLGLNAQNISLSSSGYRLIKNGRLELFVDAASLLPSFQPGHSHADTGNFCLHLDGKPIIVDTGVSTYETGATRSFERSSEAHNVVTVSNQNSSDVWKSFRVGRRAEIISFSETKCSISLTHNGFPAFPCKRTFTWTEDKLTLSDELQGKKNTEMNGRIHFHPSVELVMLNEKTIGTGQLRLNFEFVDYVKLFNYNYADGFNKLQTARGIYYTARKNTAVVNLYLV